MCCYERYSKTIHAEAVGHCIGMGDNIENMSCKMDKIKRLKRWHYTKRIVNRRLVIWNWMYEDYKPLYPPYNRLKKWNLTCGRAGCLVCHNGSYKDKGKSKRKYRMMKNHFS